MIFLSIIRSNAYTKLNRHKLLFCTIVGYCCPYYMRETLKVWEFKVIKMVEWDLVKEDALEREGNRRQRRRQEWVAGRGGGDCDGWCV